MDYIRAIERQQIREDIPQVRVADNVKVHYRIKEGDRERIQVFQGDVIRRQGESVRETFTVRKISFSIGVERTFPVHSPKIEKIEVTRKGDVRRAKLYYLRALRGKAARIAERRANWKPKAPKYTKGLLKLYSQHAVSPMKGAYME